MRRLLKRSDSWIEGQLNHHWTFKTSLIAVAVVLMQAAGAHAQSGSKYDIKGIYPGMTVDQLDTAIANVVKAGCKDKNYSVNWSNANSNEAKRSVDCPDGKMRISVLSDQKFDVRPRNYKGPSDQELLLKWSGLTLVSYVDFDFVAGGTEDEVIEAIAKQFNGTPVIERDLFGGLTGRCTSVAGCTTKSRDTFDVGNGIYLRIGKQARNAWRMTLSGGDVSATIDKSVVEREKKSHPVPKF